ncbi:DUF937 domain-containing protein [Amniculibacterium sp. G2-70]|uniref:DUF937 domain-containing protein n=1 Tax=Amniculibacterium sp. G2-70 TaxID=2767188 RepID=UPI001653F2A8|nr:DUF937 domain-containing protein [Amniculibacterium sp. G2-70]
MSLLDLLTGNSGDQVAQEAENRFGISKGQILALLAVAAPIIISQLRKNSENSSEEAENINNALNKHNGSVLNNPTEASEADGNSILSHIFGNNKANVESQLAQSSGISMDKIGPILSMLAPIVMGYIGGQKQQAGVNNGGGLGDLLGGILGNAQSQSQASNDPLSNILGSVLGGGNQQNGGGIGDLLGSVLGGGGNQQQGGLGGLLGNILGGK